MTAPEPELSIVVVFSRSSRQAVNALESLSAALQQNVAAHDFEIVAVEAFSDDLLGEQRARACAENLRYVAMGGASPWRARATDIGVRETRASYVGLVTDGAHIVTPRAVEYALAVRALGGRTLAVVPEYRIDAHQGDIDAQGAWLDALPWKNDAYGLFAHSSFGPKNANGFLGPLLGAACCFLSKASYEAVGGSPALLDRPGGAGLALHLYTELSRLPGTRLFVFPGEGAFRQAHAEVLAAEIEKEEESVHSLLAGCINAIGLDFRAVHRQPTVFGAVPSTADRFLSESKGVADYHCAACTSRGEQAWYEDL